jgi:TatD DNase family protein
MTLELIDTHCHLDLEDFKADQHECIQRALAAGVTRMITLTGLPTQSNQLN